MLVENVKIKDMIYELDISYVVIALFTFFRGQIITKYLVCVGLSQDRQRQSYRQIDKIQKSNKSGYY